MAGPIRDVRVCDPASRDQDPAAWRRGRFAERVRRAWNAVASAEVEATRRPGGGYDLETLAAAVHARAGGELGPIRQRLEEFAAAEGAGAGLPEARDPLVRPGEGAPPA